MSSQEQCGGRSGGLRERKKQQTRQAIHESALRLVDDNGLEATTIERICEAADISPRTFFNYYPSKAAAVLGLPERAIPEPAAQHFRLAQGELVPALCEVLLTATRNGMDQGRIKRVVAERPELVPEFAHWVLSVREEFIALARERSASEEVAVSAVALVLVSFGMAMHSHQTDDTPLEVTLPRSLEAIIAARSAELETALEDPDAVPPAPDS